MTHQNNTEEMPGLSLITNISTNFIKNISQKTNTIFIDGPKDLNQQTCVMVDEALRPEQWWRLPTNKEECRVTRDVALRATHFIACKLFKVQSLYDRAYALTTIQIPSKNGVTLGDYCMQFSNLYVSEVWKYQVTTGHTINSVNGHTFAPPNPSEVII